MQHIEFRSDSNCIQFDVQFPEGGTTSPLFASSSQDKFVLLRTPDRDELRSLLTAFRANYIGALRNVLRMLPTETGTDRYWSDKPVVVGLSGTPFDSNGKANIRLLYFRQSAITEAVESLGLDRKYPLRDSEFALARVHRLDRADQEVLVDYLTSQPLVQWADNLPSFQQEMRLFLDPELEQDLSRSDDPLAFLDAIAGECIEMLVRGTRQARRKDRPIARYWFAKHLHHAGIWLFPLGIWSNMAQGVPRLLKAPARTCLLPESAILFFDGWMEWLKAHSRANADDSATTDSYTRTFRYIDHTSTFCFSLPISPQLFAHYRNVAHQNGSKQYAFQGSRFLWRYLHDHWKVEYGDDYESLKLAGKIKSLNREAWAWVDAPSVKLHRDRYETVVGRSEPDEHPTTIVAWAVRMRELLPLLAIKEPKGPIAALNEWLLYLCKLDALERPIPADFRAIQRSQHINSAGNPAHYTFMDFLRERDLGLETKKSGNQRASPTLDSRLHAAGAGRPRLPHPPADRQTQRKAKFGASLAHCPGRD